MLEIKTPVEVTKFVTSDAREHPTKEEARLHEGFLTVVEVVGGHGSQYEIVKRILSKFDLVERK